MWIEPGPSAVEFRVLTNGPPESSQPLVNLNAQQKELAEVRLTMPVREKGKGKRWLRPQTLRGLSPDGRRQRVSLLSWEEVWLPDGVYFPLTSGRQKVRG